MMIILSLLIIYNLLLLSVVAVFLRADFGRASPAVSPQTWSAVQRLFRARRTLCPKPNPKRAPLCNISTTGKFGIRTTQWAVGEKQSIEEIADKRRIDSAAFKALTNFSWPLFAGPYKGASLTPPSEPERH